MSDIRELYQEVIIDHGRHPRHFGKPETCTHTKEGYNPLCGDKVTVYLSMDNDLITDIHFEGCGCAISIASASLMSEVVKGKHYKELKQVFDVFHLAVTDKTAENRDLEILGKLTVLTGVREYPSRVKCATLVWHVLFAAMEKDAHEISTE